MATAFVNGITIGFDEVGEGRNTLVLVHGHPFNRTMWREQLDAAREAGWRVVVPDLRGYGETTVVPGKTTLDVFATDLAALLDHLECGSVILGGLSMGGQIVMEFYRQYPERLQGMVLAATFPHAETDEGKQARNAMADRLLRDGMDPYARDVLPKMLAARSIESLPGMANRVMTMMQTTDPAGAAAALRGRAERPSYEETLANATVPALIVVGGEDAFTTSHHAERMRQLLENSDLLWIDGVGHMPNLEHPEAFNAALVHFLERVAPGAARTRRGGVRAGATNLGTDTRRRATAWRSGS